MNSTMTGGSRGLPPRPDSSPSPSPEQQQYVSQAPSSGGPALANFRVRCETLGHGEDVFLYPQNLTLKPVPLYTTGTTFPWYCTRAPIPLALPSAPASSDPPARLTPVGKHDDDLYFSYRYAIYRAGVFHRWEQPSDGPQDVGSRIRGPETIEGGSLRKMRGPFSENFVVPGDDDVTMDDTFAHQRSSEKDVLTHELPLRLLVSEEYYTVNDVLGVTTGPPDVDHHRMRSHNKRGTKPVSTPHSRESSSSSFKGSGFISSSPGKSASAGNLSRSPRNEPPRRTKVAFGPTPPPYHGDGTSAASKQQAIHLNSTDGVVVASAFLPVLLHRSDDGVWTADWDYEALLSMQTHLRVTRVGVVKWRGWHGHTGADGSPESGVPVNERHIVEQCLRPFHCVPVWVPPPLFGEMYNGFCKGVLWPVLHNVTSVYSAFSPAAAARTEIEGVTEPLGTSRHGSDESTTESNFSQIDPELIMDDQAPHGPIHGDGGKEADLWKAYTEVNRMFANVIIQHFHEGDLVWLHGFHFMILPSMLARKIPMAKIGLFLHTPFPSSEIFRTLWCREDLLRGMLNADQVGFHLFEYARHFLTCCRRLLGMEYGMIPDGSGGHSLAVLAQGRHVGITSIHAGVEPPVLNQILLHETTVDKVGSIRDQFHGKVIFCAIDKLESVKGIPLKILGLERFLTRCPEWVGRIVLVQVGISAYERGDDYVRTKNEVASMVATINQKWPGTVQFQECAESEMKLLQRMALLRAADVVVMTSLRDGLNLMPLEFTIAHQDAMSEQGRNDGRKRGLCILSEFTSCARVMRGALQVNPWKMSEIANAFYQALTMSEDERMRRISCASEFVTRVTSQRWALAVMLDLKGVYKNMETGRYSGAGLGLGYRLLGMETGFESLDAGAVAKAYRRSKSRLLLVDYGGTILRNDNLNNLLRFSYVSKKREFSAPTEGVLKTLEALCSDKRNTVFVVSGKERHSLTATLGTIPNLGLAAEHGMFVSWPTKHVGKKRIWETLVPDRDNSWRSIAVTVMEGYTSRTHGSYIEETEMKVLWQYRDADPEFGFLQASEMEDHLSNVLRSFSVDILHGGMQEGGYVEVRPKGVNKGVGAMYIIRNLPKHTFRSKIDFALVLGDDHCDEPMLSVLRQVGRRAVENDRARQGLEPLAPIPSTVTLVDVSSCDGFVAADMETFTCTVGKKPSAAANYLNDVDEVHELLTGMVKVSTRERSHYSATDLQSLHAPLSPMSTFQASPSSADMSWTPAGRDDFTATVRTQFLPLPEKEPVSPPAKVSRTLNAYLGTIEDDDDEEAFFF